jgi:hypothetical protein
MDGSVLKKNLYAVGNSEMLDPRFAITFTDEGNQTTVLLP